MNKYIYLIVFFIILTISCSKKNEVIRHSNIENVTTISIPPNYKMSLMVDSIFSGYKFIPLETNEECLISDPQNIIIVNDRIFIQDFNKSLFCFGLDGEFQMKIGNQGRGPGEYLQLAGFDIDSIGNIYILDYRKILKYSPKGVFESSYNLNLSSKSFQCWPEQFIIIDSGFYFWSGSLAIKDNSEDKYFAMYKTSKDFELESGYFPLKHKVMNSFSRFRPYADIYNIDPIFGNDTIFSITNSKVEPRYFIDFGKNALVKDIPNEFQSLSNFKSTIAPSKSFSPRRFTETREWIYFIFSHNFNNYNVFYSKKNGKCFVSKLIPESNIDKPLVKWIDSSWGDSLLALVEPNDIISKIQDGLIDGFEIKEDELKKIQSLKVIDNPILVVCSMKSK